VFPNTELNQAMVINLNVKTNESNPANQKAANFQSIFTKKRIRLLAAVLVILIILVVVVVLIVIYLVPQQRNSIPESTLTPLAPTTTVLASKAATTTSAPKPKIKIVSTFAGNGAVGGVDGLGTAATFNAPHGITFRRSDNTAFVTDYYSSNIRSISSSGYVSTIFQGSSYNADGNYSTARFTGWLMLNVMYLVGMEKKLWGMYPQVSSKNAWLLVAEGLLKLLEIPAAKRIFRMIGDIRMVMNLERILKCEETFELQGHIFVILGDYNQAQECFLKSSKPKEAFYLRRDLLQWDQALILAEKYASEEISEICLEYGMQLEIIG
jgi:hypothetical protein